MKTRHFLITALMTACLFGCASPEERANKQIDTNTTTAQDTTGTDTLTNVNGRSGDNGTGTDTTNTAEQKAIQEKGEN
jgi:hypothetical protein